MRLSRKRSAPSASWGLSVCSPGRSRCAICRGTRAISIRCGRPGRTGSSARVSFRGGCRRSAADRRPFRRQLIAAPRGLSSAGKHGGHGRYDRRRGLRAPSEVQIGVSWNVTAVGYRSSASDGQRHGERPFSDGGQIETERVFSSASAGFPPSMKKSCR